MGFWLLYVSVAERDKAYSEYYISNIKCTTSLRSYVTSSSVLLINDSFNRYAQAYKTRNALERGRHT